MKIFPAIDIKDKKCVRLVKEILIIRPSTKCLLLNKLESIKIMGLKIYT